jgi:hypothetical protein
MPPRRPAELQCAPVRRTKQELGMCSTEEHMHGILANLLLSARCAATKYIMHRMTSLPHPAGAADRTASPPSWTTAIWRASMPVACWLVQGSPDLSDEGASCLTAKTNIYMGDSSALEHARPCMRGQIKSVCRLQTVRDEAASFAMEASEMPKLHPHMGSRKIQRWRVCLLRCAVQNERN